MNQGVQRLILALVALGVASGLFVLIGSSDTIGAQVLGEENMVYYWSPTELRDAGDKAVDATVRLGGLAKPGDAPDWDKQLPLEFYVTDADHTVKVVSTGAPPQMFREGIGVVVEGQLGDDGVFRTDRVMVKHSNEYRVPEEGEEMAEVMKTMEPGS